MNLNLKQNGFRIQNWIQKILKLNLNFNFFYYFEFVVFAICQYTKIFRNNTEQLDW